MRLIPKGRWAVALVAPLAFMSAAVPTIAGPAAANGSGNNLSVYSPAIPAGASASVTTQQQGLNGTVTVLRLKGFAPNTVYGAHAHNNACSTTSGAAAGPHYQFLVDPVTPSTNPQYANPRNEIWLDVKTNPSGNGTSVSRVDWVFPADRRAKSVIIHAEPTRTGPTDSGVAGPRLACVDVAF